MSRDQRSHLFGEVNDRIYELLEASEPDLPGEFLCECGSECGRRVLLLPAEFAALRRGGEAVHSPDCRSRLHQPGRERSARGVPALS
jgi:hypothetical protein